MFMEIVETILNIIIEGIGYIGIFVIVAGTVQGFWMFLKSNSFWQIRLVLVKHILLGLDFLIGRDIIETVILKTEKTLWLDLAVLALIISLRVIFSYFTSREMNELEGKHSLEKI